MATLQQKAVESWDDDTDFADIHLSRNHIFTTSLSGVKTSVSSRHSVRSESNTGEDDWQVPLTTTDDHSLNKAISSAKEAGIPIPTNVPSSALLGGQIRRLGNGKKRAALPHTDDWGEDLDLPDGPVGTLKVKPRRPQPVTPSGDELDDFDDWAEGSLGVRFGGTRRGSNIRSSSASAMSPSLGSNLTLESEDEGLAGLVLPPGPLNFEAALKKRKAAEADDGTPVPAKRTPSQAAIHTPTPRHDDHDDHDDFFADIELDAGVVFDPKKRTLNRNVKPTWKSAKDVGALPKAQTTLTFTEKATTRIPRPVSATKTARLEPVFESGATNVTRPRRVEATTTSAQLLRSKRSMPALRSHQPTLNKAPSVPFLHGGHAHSNSYHVPPSSRPLQAHLRRDSDTGRPQSPTLRSHSRLSAGMSPETPTRARRDLAPAALAREAAAKRSVTRPARRRNFGDGTELDSFDDLPTSAAKESNSSRVREVNESVRANERVVQDDAAKKGMHWNSTLCRWEGNDNALAGFEAVRAVSPPRPALITNMAGTQGVQVVGGMVFDPQRMCWLKMRGAPSEAASPLGEQEEDDPFRGIDDLPDTTMGNAADGGVATVVAGAGASIDFPVGEEFDLGPDFIRRQREEEVAWRARTGPWMSARHEGHGEEYLWALRQITQ
ncbi:hypothetical protein FH972_022502 [Carpinus fangiana]|uniref:Uncharacterized protein n=1 Tax=Carpinus fangiana TaxID=176857 RepID=A0A5N6KSZ5_9ROSI|nr:hypothetical protein FH972_022502 [Carpinus fangiana]